MSARVVLDHHDHSSYTNLDFISGRVILNTNYDITITAINVKLEGESRTRLAGPRTMRGPIRPHDRSERLKTELEIHKVLYKIQTVFPSPELLQHTGPGSSQYTLAAGSYEYSFKFKFPFNNDCKSGTSPFQDLKFGQLNVNFAQEPLRHLKRPLPPTLGGFPGEAGIKYYIKATVVRPKFYHENLRVEHPLTFLPIEPPRPENQGQEQYARRQHQFMSSPKDTKLSILRRTPDIAATDDVPSIRIDARLPSPAILTCHSTIPLRVLVQRLNSSPASLYLTMFQLELIAFTQIKAHDLARTEITSWILVSKANMDMVLDVPTDPNATETVIPPHLWSQITLPSSVTPSFETCNLLRRYELEVRVGISHSMANRSRPEVAILPLRIPVQVYSGIRPPPELLNRIGMSTSSAAAAAAAAISSVPRPNQHNNKINSPSKIQQQQKSSLSPNPSNTSSTTAAGGSRPEKSHIPSSNTHTQPTSSSTLAGTAHDLDPDDLPPSYEDAMAEDLGPVDGPRRHFDTTTETAQRQTPTQTPTYTGDSKSSYGSESGLNRHPSERLFSQNAPRPPGPSVTSGLGGDQSNTLFEDDYNSDDGNNETFHDIGGINSHVNDNANANANINTSASAGTHTATNTDIKDSKSNTKPTTKTI